MNSLKREMRLILLALAICIYCFILLCCKSFAEEGVFRGVPYSITDGKLVIGEKNQTYSFSNNDDTDFPWKNSSTVTSVAFAGKVVGNGDHSRMFYRLSNCTKIDFNNFDASGITNMSGFLEECSSLTSVNAYLLDTRNVTDMSNMFHNCSSLTSLVLSNTKTVNTSKFNTKNVTDMSDMFRGCSSIRSGSLYMSDFDTSKVTNMAGMFYLVSCNKDVSNFDTSNVTNMGGMFCSLGFAATGCENFNTSKVTNMCGMFFGCQYLGDRDFSNYDTSNVTDMSEMFVGCGKNRTISLNISSFDTSKVVDMHKMFYGAQISEIDVSGFDTSNVTDMSYMFCSAPLGKLELSSFDTSKVVDMTEMFYATKVSELDLSNFDTSNVKNMSRMFGANYNLKSLDLSNFNTVNVTNMEGMFKDCLALNSLDLSSFDTKNVQNMTEMLEYLKQLDSIKLGENIVFNEDDIAFTFHRWKHEITNVEYSAEELIKNYDGKTMSGIYTVIHSYDEGTVTKEPTCIETGIMQYICSECGDIATSSIPLADHMWDDHYRISKPPTCTEEGIEAQYCIVCSTENEDSRKTIPALGHSWMKPTYEWSIDKSQVVAKRVCSHDKSHRETEIAYASSEITKEPTYAAKGVTTYTASFLNPAFETCKISVANIPILPKESNTMTVKSNTVKIKYKKVKKKTMTLSSKKAFIVKMPQGKVTYKIIKMDKKAKKKIKVSSTGKITVKKGLKKGIYKIQVSIKATGTIKYNPLIRNVTLKIIVK